MKKEKGFTLVELIAVIILLGIIALIAIPTVNELLKEARMSAFEDTAYGLVRAGTLYYQKQELKDEVTSNITFTFPEASGLEVSGKKPSSGTMIVDIDGNVQLAVSNGRYCARKGFKDSEITLDTDIDNCTITKKIYTIGDSVYFNPVQNQICSDYVEGNSVIGVKTGCMRFYIYKEDTSNYGLILDHNTTAIEAWISSADAGTNTSGTGLVQNDKGPITLMNRLKADTETWKVEADIIEAEDVFNLIPYYVALDNKEDFKNGGTSYEEYLNLHRAALNDTQTNVQQSDYDTIDEYVVAIEEYMEENYSNVILPSELYRNFVYEYAVATSTGTSLSTTGYWTKTAYPKYSSSAWCVFALGGVVSDLVSAGDTASGVRPVITIPKNLLS